MQKFEIVHLKRKTKTHTFYLAINGNNATCRAPSPSPKSALAYIWRQGISGKFIQGKYRNSLALAYVRKRDVDGGGGLKTGAWHEHMCVSLCVAQGEHVTKLINLPFKVNN